VIRMDLGGDRLRAWIGLNLLSIGLVMGCCDCGDEPSSPDPMELVLDVCIVLIRAVSDITTPLVRIYRSVGRPALWCNVTVKQMNGNVMFRVGLLLTGQGYGPGEFGCDVK
jgi:hypothetical protein